MSQTADLPHWQLTSIFPGLGSPEFEQAKAELKARTEALAELMDAWQVGVQESVPVDPETVALFDELVERFNDLYTRLGTIYPYLSGLT